MSFQFIECSRLVSHKKEDSFIHNFYCLCLQLMLLDSKTMKLEDCNFSFVKIQIAKMQFSVGYSTGSTLILRDFQRFSPYIFLK